MGDYTTDENGILYVMPSTEGTNLPSNPLVQSVVIFPIEGGVGVTLKGESVAKLSNIQSSVEQLAAIAQSAKNDPPSTHFIHELKMEQVDHEYQFVFPEGTKEFAFRHRNKQGDIAGAFRCANTPGLVEVAPDSLNPGIMYFRAGEYYTQSGKYFNTNTSYFFATSIANVWLTIEYWT